MGCLLASLCMFFNSLLGTALNERHEYCTLRRDLFWSYNGSGVRVPSQLSATRLSGAFAFSVSSYIVHFLLSLPLKFISPSVSFNTWLTVHGQELTLAASNCLDLTVTYFPMFYLSLHFLNSLLCSYPLA